MLKAVGMAAVMAVAVMVGVVHADEVGVTDTTISIGSFAPLSGPRAPLSVYNRQIEAYFKWVNDLGGVKAGDGKTRKILFRLIDTGGQPARALAATRELVESDRVFALLSPFGQNENLAVADYLNAKKVPHLFLNTAGQYWGANPVKLPWSIGFPPAAGTQVGVGAAYIRQVRPNAKIAILHGNDEYGKEIIEALRRSIKDSGVSIVAVETYEYNDTSVDSQVIKLAASGADVFLNYAIGRPSLQALQKAHDLGWNPLRLVETTAATAGLVKQLAPDVAEGVISTNYYKDPNLDEFKTDPAIVRYQQIMQKYYGPGFDPTTQPIGPAEGELFVKIVETLNPVTRDSVIKAARALSNVELSYLLPGIRLNTSANDGFPIDQMQVIVFGNGVFRRVGDIAQASPL